MAKAVACMQLNCHHSTSATANLVNELLESTHIACIQEPHLVKGKPAGLGSQLQYYSKGENPRAVVMASKNINFWPAPQFSSRDMATSIIKQDKLFYIASVYLDITQQDEHFFPSELSLPWWVLTISSRIKSYGLEECKPRSRPSLQLL